MWGKSQLNRRNIVLVALTTSTAALALAGPVQAQEAAVPVPTVAASVDMVKARVLKLKDPDGNKPDEVAVRCVRTATQAGRKCIVKVQYPELECTDATVMATLRTSAGVSKPFVVGLKLRCVRTVDLEDDSTDEDTTVATPAPAPAEQAPAPVQQAPAPAPAETDEQRAARQREEELKAIEAAMLAEEMAAGGRG
jgi:hypothetical protein